MNKASSDFYTPSRSGVGGSVLGHYGDTQPVPCQLPFPATTWWSVTLSHTELMDSDDVAMAEDSLWVSPATLPEKLVIAPFLQQISPVSVMGICNSNEHRQSVMIVTIRAACQAR